MRKLAGGLLVLVMGLSVAGYLQRREAPASPPPTIDEWYGAYLQGQKIGYMHVAIRPFERDGEQLLEYAAQDFVQVAVLGAEMTQTTSSITVCDLAYRPLEAEITIGSKVGGKDASTAVSAVFHEDRIDCRKTSREGTVPVTVPIPEGIKLVVDERALLADGKLHVGDSVEMYQFNPLTLGIDQHTLTALRTEPLALPGETIDATVVEMKSKYTDALAWVDDQGRMCKLELALSVAKLEFRRESEEQALASATEGETGPRIDLVVATALRPSTPIDDPRQAKRLVLKIRGLDKLDTVPSGDWQMITPEDDGSDKVVIDIAVKPEPKPLTAEELAPYLAATTYIEADHPDIKAAAAEALGDPAPSGAAARARRIHDFVHGHVQWQSSIGLFRSALEILHDQAGVCRDSAALFTALARAAGVPTRVCAGLVYVNGAFMGHAWAECWVGDRWEPYDATLAGAFVDATHLKLAQGAEYTCLFEMLPALGNLKIEVVEVGH